MKRKPEQSGASASAHYSQGEERRYTAQNAEVQHELARCCLWHLQAASESARSGVPLLLLDLGCGSGLSTDILRAAGHAVVGLDVAHHMLQLQSVEQRGLLIESNMGGSLPVRCEGCFDGAVSVSALQWLAAEGQRKMFESLRAALCPGAVAVFQFYPTPSQAQVAAEAAADAGLLARLVVDVPHPTRAIKLFLCVRRPCEVVDAQISAVMQTGQSSDAAGHKQSHLAAAEADVGCCPLAFPMPASCRMIAERAVPNRPPPTIYPPHLDGVTCCDRRAGQPDAVHALGWSVLIGRCACARVGGADTTHAPVAQAEEYRHAAESLRRMQHQHMKYSRRLLHALTPQAALTASPPTSGGRELSHGRTSEGGVGATPSRPVMAAAATCAAGDVACAFSALFYFGSARGGGCEDALLLEVTCTPALRCCPTHATSAATPPAAADAITAPSSATSASEACLALCNAAVEVLVAPLELSLEHLHLPTASAPAPPAPHGHKDTLSAMRVPGSGAHASAMLHARIEAPCTLTVAADRSMRRLHRAIRLLRSRRMAVCGARVWLEAAPDGRADADSTTAWQLTVQLAFRIRDASGAIAVGHACTDSATATHHAGQGDTSNGDGARGGEPQARPKQRAQRSARAMDMAWDVADRDALLGARLAIELVEAMQDESARPPPKSQE